MQHGMRVEQEAARIRAGGAPRPVAIGGGAPAQAAPNAVSGAMPGAVPPPGYGQQPAYGAAPGYAQPGAPVYGQQPGAPAYGQQPGAPAYGQQPNYNQQAAQFGNEVGNAFSAFGSALGSFVNGAVAGFLPGSPVMVQWSDGQRYPGTVTTSQAGQVQVAFPDGRQVWVPQQFVSAR
jgi:hypothetical protein